MDRLSPTAPVPCRTCGEPRPTIGGIALPCRPCSDRAAAADEARQAADLAAVARVEGEKALARWLASVPARFRWATATPPAPELAKRVQEAPRRIASELATPTTVLLAGRSGSGKSSLAAALVTRWARAGARCLWLSAAAVDEMTRASRLGTEEPDDLRRAKRAAVLVLDDLGTEGKIGTEAIVGIVHRRHDADLATVATTGLTGAVMAERYGAGIVRRLTCGVLVRMGGESQ